MSKSRTSITKLKKPIIFENIFNVFDDNRGFLTALDAQKMFKKIPGLNFNLSYQLISYNEKKHTFRGMHYQDQPFAQNKLILVHKGSIIDLAIDLSKKETNKILRFELSAGDAIFIPKGFAHGFISLTDNVLLQYFMDDKYSQENYKGLNIKKYLKKEFPDLDIIISEKDSNLSDYKP